MTENSRTEQWKFADGFHIHIGNLSQKGWVTIMEKKEFQKIVKDKMKELGFHVRGNYIGKYIDDDYLICMYLDHHPYCKGYFIEYGPVYLPDGNKTPYRRWFDWFPCSPRFYFTKKLGDDLSKYAFDDPEHFDGYDNLLAYFEYDIRSSEELETQLDINIKKLLNRLYDKCYALNFFKNDIDLLDDFYNSKTTEAFKSLIRVGNFDMKALNQYRQEVGETPVDSELLE